MKTAYLALGSNLGDRAASLARALELLARDELTAISRLSSVYETAPIGPVPQPDFYNLVCEIQTIITAPELLTHCLELEADLGRVRREAWGPRTIDIDLLWYDEERIDTRSLTLPHPRMLERSFVMVPLAEIAPRLVLDGETAASHAASLGGTGIRRVGLLTELIS